MTRPTSPLLTRLLDGTVIQLNPFSGMQVWTVPGRGDRPIEPTAAPQPIDLTQAGRYCAFCEERKLDATPERARLVRSEAGWELLTDLGAEELDETVAEFRVLPNLFEIVTLDHWRISYGHRLPADAVARRDAYLSSAAGRAHVKHVLAARPGVDPDFLFGGFHDVVVSRRHYVDGAVESHELAGSGTLTPEEHRFYVAFTVAGMRRLYAEDDKVRQVAAFQNWLRPAGASFDHLHKQLVGLPVAGPRLEHDLALIERDPGFFDWAGIGSAREHDLVVAENEHAVAFAAFGRRYPALEVWHRRGGVPPWEMGSEELGGWADLLQACHAATGVTVPTNEEWQHCPPQVDAALPLRAVLKWRISTLAGFEGGTDIAVNTVDPWRVRDRTRAALAGLQREGRVAADLTVPDPSERG